MQSGLTGVRSASSIPNSSYETFDRFYTGGLSKALKRFLRGT